MPFFARRPGSLPALGALAAAALLVAAAVSAPTGCATAGPCTLNSDCVNAYCDEGVCKKDCVDAELDCPPGHICGPTAQCRPPGEGGGSPAGSGGGSVGGGGAGSGASPPTSTGTGGVPTSTSTGGSPGTGHALDPCSTDADCASPLVCLPMTPSTPSRCTRACSSNAECVSGTRCLPVAGGQYCVEGDVGRHCTTAAECNYGCLSNQQYCTTPCATGADCPNGYGCMGGIGNPPQSICVKAEAYCTAQSAAECIAPSACDESPGLVIGGCTLVCNSGADCPRRAAGLAPWSCSQGLCKRPADVKGSLENGYAPAQYACDANSNVVNLCNDNLHIDFDNFVVPAAPAVNCNSPTTTDGLPGDACVDSCRYQGGCPFGSACVAVGNVGNARIGLCLPRGGGAVGVACSKDRECAFGYCASGKCSRDCTADGVCPTGSTCVAAGGPAVEGAQFRRCQ
jgi:hypothetical protein